jgi:hypothetical protein
MHSDTTIGKMVAARPSKPHPYCSPPQPTTGMNYSRIALAGLGGTVAYFALGFLLFAVLPLADEVRQFAAVYRPEESMMRVAPVGMAAMLVAMLALAALCAFAFRDGSSFAHAMRFGLLVGVFAAGSFVLHNYVSLNIGLRLALLQAFAYFVQMVGAATAIALIYRPTRAAARSSSRSD